MICYLPCPAGNCGAILFGRRYGAFKKVRAPRMENLERPLGRVVQACADLNAEQTMARFLTNR